MADRPCASEGCKEVGLHQVTIAEDDQATYGFFCKDHALAVIEAADRQYDIQSLDVRGLLEDAPGEDGDTEA